MKTAAEAAGADQAGTRASVARREVILVICIGPKGASVTSIAARSGRPQTEHRRARVKSFRLTKRPSISAAPVSQTLT